MKAFVPYVALALVVGGLGWSVEHYRLSAELAYVRQTHSQQLRMLTETHAAELKRAIRQAEGLQGQLTALDIHYTQELTHAQAETAALRDAVDAGARRLLIHARSSKSCSGVPGTTDDTRLGDGTAIELSPAARRAYFRLRAGVNSDTAKLAACQDILRQLTKRTD